MKKLFLLLCLFAFLPALAWGNACVAVAGTNNFRTAAAWTSCGSTYPQSTDTATIAAAGALIVIPAAESDTVAGISATGTGVLSCSGPGGANTVSCALDIKGTLTTGATTGNVVTASASSIVVESGGALDFGSAPATAVTGLTVNDTGALTCSITAISLSGSSVTGTCSNSFLTGGGQAVLVSGLNTITSTITGNTTQGSKIITNVNTSGLVVGQPLYDSLNAIEPGCCVIEAIGTNWIKSSGMAAISVNGDSFTVETGSRPWLNNLLVHTTSATSTSFTGLVFPTSITPASYSGSDTGSASTTGELLDLGTVEMSDNISLNSGALVVGAGGILEGLGATAQYVVTSAATTPPYSFAGLWGSGWTGQTTGSAPACGSGSGAACVTMATAGTTDNIGFNQNNGGYLIFASNYGVLENAGTSSGSSTGFAVQACSMYANYLAFGGGGTSSPMGQMVFNPKNATDCDTANLSYVTQDGITSQNGIQLEDTTPRDTTGNLRRIDHFNSYSTSTSTGQTNINGPHSYITNSTLGAVVVGTSSGVHSGILNSIIGQSVNSSSGTLQGWSDNSDNRFIGDIFLAIGGTGCANYHAMTTGATPGTLTATIEAYNIIDGGTTCATNPSSGYIFQAGGPIIQKNELIEYMSTFYNGDPGTAVSGIVEHNIAYHSGGSGGAYQNIVDSEAGANANKWGAEADNLFDTINSYFSHGQLITGGGFIPQHNVACTIGSGNITTTSTGTSVTIPLTSCNGTPTVNDAVRLRGFTSATWLNGKHSNNVTAASTSSVTFTLADWIAPASYAATESTGTIIFGFYLDYNNAAGGCSGSTTVKEIWNPGTNAGGCFFPNGATTGAVYMTATAPTSVASTTQQVITTATNLANATGYLINCSGDVADYAVITSVTGTNPYTVNYASTNSSGGTGLPASTSGCATTKNTIILYPPWDPSTGAKYGDRDRGLNETFFASDFRDNTRRGETYSTAQGGAGTNPDLVAQFEKQNNWDETGKFVATPNTNYNYGTLFDWYKNGFSSMLGSVSHSMLDGDDQGIVGWAFRPLAMASVN